jgi:hypothetical protein
MKVCPACESPDREYRSWDDKAGAYYCTHCFTWLTMPLPGTYRKRANV